MKCPEIVAKLAKSDGKRSFLLLFSVLFDSFDAMREPAQQPVSGNAMFEGRRRNQADFWLFGEKSQKSTS